MIHVLSDLDNFAIDANDGKVGKVTDFYFDDRRWVIRYLVVDIGSALKSHKVLLSPARIKHLNKEEKTITVDMSLNEIANSPCIDTRHALPSHYEIDYLSYHGYAFNWDRNSQKPVSIDDETSAIFDETLGQKSASAQDVLVSIDSVRRMYGDRHLRSYQEIIGYCIQANDGDIGYLKSVLIDDDTWNIKCCIVKTSNWWFGHHVFITPQAIRDISWGSTKIYVDMTQQQVKEAPSFDYSLTQNNSYESGVYLHQESTHASAEAAPETYN